MCENDMLMDNITDQTSFRMQESYIDTPEQLEQFCNAISGSTWLAIDTEFIREKTYYPKFCLLQVSNGEHAACIDPLAIDDLTPILDILYQEDTVKVLHAAHQDLEIFHHLWDKIPQPIFDTQLAAAITGYGDQMGYARLVQQALQVSLEKDQARTDWSKRPLDQAQIKYALNDVIHLGEIYQQLDAKLNRLGRTDWLNAEYEHFSRPSTYRIEADHAWKKVKGRQHLKGVQYAVLQTLAGWRETRAIELDRPRRWILKDEVLVDLARRMPSKVQQLSRIRGLEDGVIGKQGEQILQLIQQARQIPETDWPFENIPTRKLSKQEEALSDLMMCALRLIADEQDITAAAIAGKKDIEKIICGNTDTTLLEGWRNKIAGEKLQAVANKQLIPCWNNSQLSLCSCD